MPNTSVRAAAEGMPKSERGRVPSLYKLIAIYWDRYAALDQATTKLDECKDDDAPARKKVDAAHSRASDRVTDALVDICAFLPTWKYEAKIKARFIEATVTDSGADIEPEALAALLESVAKVILPAKEPAKEGGAS